MQKAKNRGRPRQCRSRRCHIKERKAPDKLFFADEDEANPPREPQQSTTQAMLYFGSCQDQQEITVHMQSPARDQAMRRRQIAGLGVEQGGQITRKARPHLGVRADTACARPQPFDEDRGGAPPRRPPPPPPPPPRRSPPRHTRGTSHSHSRYS